MAIFLSKLKVFAVANHIKEQYPTDSEIAADVLWQALLLGDIQNKNLVDLGCGSGILGIGASILGAKKIHFNDIDQDALNLAKKQFNELISNYKLNTRGFFFLGPMSSFEAGGDYVNTAIMNPPFGTRTKHIDRDFLAKAFTLAPIVYSFHKTSTVDFLKKFSEQNNFVVTHVWDYSFPLKNTQKFHRKKIHRIEVSCLRFVKFLC